MSELRLREAPIVKDKSAVVTYLMFIRRDEDGYLYYNLGPNPDISTRMPDEFDVKTYKTKLFNGRPGAIYAVDYNAEKEGFSVWRPTATYAGFWPFSDQVAYWQLLHDTGEAVRAAQRYEKKHISQNIWHENLDPFREAYWNTSSKGQKILIAQVVEYITRRPTKK